ncbi:MAG: TOBE domain-containing protein, partial [Halocynthiibacter sp.]
RDAALLEAAPAVEVAGLNARYKLPLNLPVTGTNVGFGVRPEHAEIDRNGDTHTIELTEAMGGVSYAYLKSDTGEKFIVEERGDHRSETGIRVGVRFPMDRAMLFDRDTGLRIR